MIEAYFDCALRFVVGADLAYGFALAAAARCAASRPIRAQRRSSSPSSCAAVGKLQYDVGLDLPFATYVNAAEPAAKKLARETSSVLMNTSPSASMAKHKPSA